VNDRAAAFNSGDENDRALTENVDTLNCLFI
jgi:hypothetical protein